MRSFGLLTGKPQVVLLNATHGDPIPDSVLVMAPDALAIDAKLELELAEMNAEDRSAFMADLGLTELGRDRIIRAEVTAFDDLHRLGSVREVKANNLQRLEGKDYIVKDGDIMFFRSSV
jgi:ribosome-binding ATPase YchF (GTP1/OBG family)